MKSYWTPNDINQYIEDSSVSKTIFPVAVTTLNDIAQYLEELTSKRKEVNSIEISPEDMLWLKKAMISKPIF